MRRVWPRSVDHVRCLGKRQSSKKLRVTMALNPINPWCLPATSVRAALVSRPKTKFNSIWVKTKRVSLDLEIRFLFFRRYHELHARRSTGDRRRRSDETLFIHGRIGRLEFVDSNATATRIVFSSRHFTLVHRFSRSLLPFISLSSLFILLGDVLGLDLHDLFKIRTDSRRQITLRFLYQFGF